MNVLKQTHHNKDIEFSLCFWIGILFYNFFWHTLEKKTKHKSFVDTVSPWWSGEGKGLPEKEPHRLFAHFLKGTADWIKMDGGINMTTHWRASQVALVAPEDALKNESTHSRACTLNCKCTTQAYKINVSGVPISLDWCLLLSGNHDMY